MNTLESLLASDPYGLALPEKRKALLAELLSLTQLHQQRCPPYANILRALQFDSSRVRGLEDLVYLPVRLFKLMDLRSVPSGEVFKVIQSSGTTSQRPSRVALDAATSQLQTRVLSSILASYLGKQRGPMVIFDSQSVLKDRGNRSARAAAILGMSTFGRNHFYALDDQMSPRWDELASYLEGHGAGRVFFFGFTFMIWQHVLERLRAERRRLNVPDGVLIHGGGWKKLETQAVGKQQFKSAVAELLGVRRVHDFYGMAEQSGNIYMECERGHFHAPTCAEVLVRGIGSWRALEHGREGVLQTLSVAPRSYPGHSLLTEDLAVIHGVDDCACGRKGTYFSVLGRIPMAELRGCGDTYAEELLAAR